MGRLVETSLTWLARLGSAPAGDADWRQLVDVYGPLLREWLSRSGVANADRDDLIQEVLLVVVRRITSFDHRGPGSFRSWLRGILANHIRKYFRERTRAAQIDLDQLAADDSALARAWDQEHDRFLAARALRIVERDFAPATWAAFCRHVLHGQSPAEVSAALGLSINSVLLAKSRVLKRVRQELDGLVE